MSSFNQTNATFKWAIVWVLILTSATHQKVHSSFEKWSQSSHICSHTMVNYGGIRNANDSKRRLYKVNFRHPHHSFLVIQRTWMNNIQVIGFNQIYTFRSGKEIVTGSWYFIFFRCSFYVFCSFVGFLSGILSMESLWISLESDCLSKNFSALLNWVCMGCALNLNKQWNFNWIKQSSWNSFMGTNVPL